MIVKEAAAGLSGANVSVLNGAEGLSEIAAGLVAQGLTILDSVKKSLSVPVAEPVTMFDSPNGAQSAGIDDGPPSTS
jgi:hypothetical protein